MTNTVSDMLEQLSQLDQEIWSLKYDRDEIDVHLGVAYAERDDLLREIQKIQGEIDWG